MIKLVFPYGLKLSLDGKITASPTLPIYFKLKKKKIFALPLIDSGAEITLLTKDDAKNLGIDLEAGQKMLITGIVPTFDIIGYRHRVKVEINHIKFEIPVLFANSNEVPRVLGREGIFERFYIIFGEKEKQTIFVVRNPESKKQLKTILNN